MSNHDNTAPRTTEDSRTFSQAAPFTSWNQGRDIQIFGILLIFAGSMDLIWIAAYPDYALTVFGTTFTGITGVLVKYQHPVIHWILGYGFFTRKGWAYWGYLAYLGLGCLSELTTQMIQGYHSTRTTMILVSLLFGAYILFRRHVFSSSRTLSASELNNT